MLSHLGLGVCLHIHSWFTFSFAVSPCLHSFFQAVMRNQETWYNLAERRLCLEWEAQMYEEHFCLVWQNVSEPIVGTGCEFKN